LRGGETAGVWLKVIILRRAAAAGEHFSKETNTTPTNGWLMLLLLLLRGNCPLQQGGLPYYSRRGRRRRRGEVLLHGRPSHGSGGRRGSQRRARRHLSREFNPLCGREAGGGEHWRRWFFFFPFLKGDFPHTPPCKLFKGQPGSVREMLEIIITPPFLLHEALCSWRFHSGICDPTPLCKQTRKQVVTVALVTTAAVLLPEGSPK